MMSECCRIVSIVGLSLCACGDSGSTFSAEGGGTVGGGTVTGSQVGQTAADSTAAYGSGSAASVGTTAIDPGATEGGTSGHSTTSQVSSSSADGGTQGATSTDSGAMGEQVLVQNSQQTACDAPLWCTQGDVVIGGPMAGQECFVAPISPPFRLEVIHYTVESTTVELQPFAMQVRQRDPDGPGAVIASVMVTSADATPTSHDLVLEQPVLIDEQEFCIGFETTSPGLQSGVGMAVDLGDSIAGVSFVRMAARSCDTSGWQDNTALMPAAAGNWCMSATIRG